MYDRWAERIASRVQRRFDEIEATHNFDYGPEFEIAIARLLQDVLPERAGVCRGFVVSRDDSKAGDDIIVYDRLRFPTLRLLGRDLAQKEGVPLEAVLAYIEAKHTLYFEEAESHGQSWAKACAQVRAVYSLPAREGVSALQVTPYLSLRPDQFAPVSRVGYFDRRNPLYCAVYARNFAFTESQKRDPNLDEAPRLGVQVDAALARGPIPSVVAAGELLIVPTYEGAGQSELRPVLGPADASVHASLIRGGGMGLALMHLLWAIEQFELGRVPWDVILAEAERALKRRPGDPPEQSAKAVAVPPKAKRARKAGAPKAKKAK